MPTTLVSLRIDNDLLEYLKQRAEQEHRTLSNMIISILTNEVLKEHEPITIKQPEKLDEIYNYVAECPKCGMKFTMCEDEKMKYCPGCGRRVMWG